MHFGREGHQWIQNFNEEFKAIFDGHGQVATRGETNTAPFALGAEDESHSS